MSTIEDLIFPSRRGKVDIVENGAHGERNSQLLLTAVRRDVIVNKTFLYIYIQYMRECDWHTLHSTRREMFLTTDDVQVDKKLTAGEHVVLSRRQYWFVGFQMTIVVLLVTLVSAKMMIDIAVETTILQKLRDNSLTSSVMA